MDISIENNFKSANPDIMWLSPGDDGFAQRRVTFYANDAVTPKAIICPHTAEDVQAVVQFARHYDLPFTVRSGGHDLQGRSVMHDILCIDMRDMNAVEISSDRKTAKIGGGILTGKLEEELSQYGLFATFGNVSDVGFFGWASLGGYGITANHYGLGVDQILQAEVVDSNGMLVQATSTMLKAIKGAGGNFGVVTSMEIKIYELHAMLSGMLIIDTAAKGLAETFKQVMIRIQELQAEDGLLPAMNISPMVLNHPENGKVFILGICWSSDDHEAGRRNLQRICNILPATVLMSTVTNMTVMGHIGAMSAFFGKSYWGGSEAVSYSVLSTGTLDTIGRYLEMMPKDPGTAFVVHSLRDGSPSVSDHTLAESSCFPEKFRTQHWMLELIGFATTELAGPESVQWAGDFCSALADGGEAMEGTYISLSGKRGASMERIYGKSWEVIKKLKKQLDPHWVFKYAVPVAR